ncbi:MAG: hypothetical protein PHP69_04640 [Candidatus Omnitrophica bacterium]|jgi:Flp pilus assembly pilin Flp|nr:hypothetical protein [Candidatus Omnitrophota bacterium]MDD5081659.1 hypothetical protein [Candidatus Omnitrophota bacterium]
MKKRKAQTAITYAALIAFVVVSLIIISGYLQGRVQGMYKSAGDSIGDEEQKD